MWCNKIKWYPVGIESKPHWLQTLHYRIEQSWTGTEETINFTAGLQQLKSCKLDSSLLEFLRLRFIQFIGSRRRGDVRIYRI